MKATFGKFTSILGGYLGDMGYNKLCLTNITIYKPLSGNAVVTITDS